jgi:hypothetical protein
VGARVAYGDGTIQQSFDAIARQVFQRGEVAQA